VIKKDSKKGDMLIEEGICNDSPTCGLQINRVNFAVAAIRKLKDLEENVGVRHKIRNRMLKLAFEGIVRTIYEGEMALAGRYSLTEMMGGYFIAARWWHRGLTSGDKDTKYV
jgi:hypothetical protein